MKLIHSMAVVILSLAVCQAQNSHSLKRQPTDAYTLQLISLLSGLQKNPWQGWKADTVVVVRYLGDDGRASKPLAYVQPDLVYRILEADKLFIRTQVLNGKVYRQDFLVKDQTGLEAASPNAKGTPAAEMELDGFKLPVLLFESRLDEFPGGSWITREWALAGHPSILLRKEVNGVGWRVTSAKVLKKIGEREFLCVEIRERMSIYSDGHIDVVTTRYLSPEVPGHLVEEIQEFSRIGKKQERLAPHMVIHQKVVEVKLQ